MNVAQAGWYPDPTGDTTRIRYWDGAQWTDQYQYVNPAPEAEATSAADADSTAHQAAQPADSTYQQPYQATQPAKSSEQMLLYPGAIYPMTSTDQTLRLIAFIFNIITCVATGILLIPLCWTIPMTVHSWGIYKGTKPNTVAFGVCTLLFLNLIGGILLLVSNKNEPTGTPTQYN